MTELDKDGEQQSYKEFTTEEEKIYNRAMEKVKEQIEAGYTLDEACDGLDLKDEELRRFVREDYLKVLIADLHYSKRKSFEEIGEMLHIDLKRVQQAHTEMVEDVKIASIAAYKESRNQKGSA